MTFQCCQIISLLYRKDPAIIWGLLDFNS